MTGRELIAKGADSLRASEVENPEREAALALASAMGCSTAEVYIKQEIMPVESERFDEIISRRAKGEPLQLILGEWEFFGRRILLERGVFVPRPETEGLVEIVLERLRDLPLFGLEFGVGSGAICVSILAERPRFRMVGIDIDPKAIELTRKNAELHGVIGRLHLVVGEDSLEDFEKFDFIVSNPPYILASEMADLPREVRFDPPEALSGGPDGMAVISKIAELAKRRLRPAGLLAMEIHEDMGARTAEVLKENLSSIEILKDASGKERYIIAQKERDGKKYSTP
ncbi:peptide chain release factor N(5)-glutamine methyltransferase [bacterium]|nr:peptide chain release factor N(5)-glutamine methyltransferase [bacterium]